METENKKHDNSITRSDANTQCGDALTVDEENILVMVKSFSPQRQLDSESEKEEERGGADEKIEADDNDIEVSLIFYVYRCVYEYSKRCGF